MIHNTARNCKDQDDVQQTGRKQHDTENSRTSIPGHIIFNSGSPHPSEKLRSFSDKGYHYYTSKNERSTNVFQL